MPVFGEPNVECLPWKNFEESQSMDIVEVARRRRGALTSKVEV
jgi:hypothetical protein